MTKNSAPVPEHGKLITLPGKRVGRLDRITNWEQLAESSCYSASVLAHRCGVSRRHLERHIRAVLAVTLGEWLLELRLRQACKLLGQGWSVKETAFSTGFRQVSHFSRCFKRRFGVVPSSVFHSTDLLPDQDRPADPRQLVLPELALLIDGGFAGETPSPSSAQRSIG